MATDTCGLQRAKSPARIPIGASWTDIMEEREKMAERYVFLIDIAESLGVPSNPFVNRMMRGGIETIKIRNRETGHPALAVTESVARSIIEAERNPIETIKPEQLFERKGD